MTCKAHFSSLLLPIPPVTFDVPEKFYVSLKFMKELELERGLISCSCKVHFSFLKIMKELETRAWEAFDFRSYFFSPIFDAENKNYEIVSLMWLNCRIWRWSHRKGYQIERSSHQRLLHVRLPFFQVRESKHIWSTGIIRLNPFWLKLKNFVWARRKKRSVSKEGSTTLRFYQGSGAWGSSMFVQGPQMVGEDARNKATGCRAIFQSCCCSRSYGEYFHNDNKFCVFNF